MANKKLPVVSYPSEYLIFLKKATLDRVEVLFRQEDEPPGHTAYQTAAYVAIQINCLRQAMKAEGHPDYALVAKAQIARPKVLKNGDAVLVGHPRYQNFAKAFRESGIESEIAPDDPLHDLDDLIPPGR